MSLQSNDVRTRFVNDCVFLWQTWNTGAGVGGRSLYRAQKVQELLQRMTTFMVAPALKFKNISGWGSFNWTKWKLTLRDKYVMQADIKYEKFVEYCSTIYHETRHAEQFYRIAQGLALGRLKYPDTEDVEIKQALGVQAAGVRDKIALFGGNRALGGTITRTELLPSPRILSDWLNIPENVAQHAHNQRAAFDAFCNLARPAWFKRETTLLEVEDWMRATYKKTYAEMDSFAQREDDPPGAVQRNVYNMYRALPEENDAHSIEDQVQEEIVRGIGHASDMGERRTAVAIFGA